MGSFNISGTISRLSIYEGDKIILVPLIPNIQRLGALMSGHGIISTDGLASCFFKAFCLPIKAEYQDYGSIGNIVHDETTRCIETFFDMSIENFTHALLSWDETLSEPLSVMFEHLTIYEQFNHYQKPNDPDKRDFQDLSFEKVKNIFPCYENHCVNKTHEKDLLEEYKKWKRFEYNCYMANVTFFPQEKGPQFGSPETNFHLLQIIQEIAEKQKKER